MQLCAGHTQVRYFIQSLCSASKLESKELHMTRSATTLEATPDFSLVLGGPLFQLFRRAHLSGDALELMHRR